jgi:hypothetical protein
MELYKAGRATIVKRRQHPADRIADVVPDPEPAD